MIQYQEFKHGEKVIIDKGYQNSCEVIVLDQTKPNRIFTRVKSLDNKYTWETMTNRLTKINE